MVSGSAIVAFTSPSRMLVRSVLFTVLLLVVTGCGGSPPGQPLSHWMLHVPGQEPRAIDIPTHLDLPNRVVNYRLDSEVVVDAGLRGHDLDLIIASLPAFASLSVNGRMLDPHDAIPADQYRRAGPHRWLIPASETNAPRLKLELEVAHRWTQSAWLDLVPRLVPTGAVTPEIVRNRYLNEHGGWFGLVAFFQIGVSFLAVFFWNRSRRVYLWFAVQGVFAAYYPAFILGLTIGVFPPGLEAGILAESLAIASILSVYCTNDFFGLPPPHRGWLAVLVVSLALGLHAWILAATTGFLVISYSAPVVVLCVVSAVIYQVVTGVRLLQTDADRSVVLFYWGCWVALGSFAWPDLLAWAGGGEALSGARPACLGLGLFGVFQSMVLSRSYFRTLEQSDRLNEALRGQLHDIEARKADIEKLNEELRLQIGRRTAHILAALTNSEELSAAVRLEPGHVIEGRYRVIGVIGEGGMGSVYEVERVSDGVRLALKVAQEARGLALARLAREAQIATKIHHPNVVSIVDADVAQSGYVYLVMELVRGTSLAECKGRSPGFYLDVLSKVLEGLRALHAQNIVHRDLKPANVLLSGDLNDDPIVKITDFGISRLVSDERRRVSLTPIQAHDDLTSRFDAVPFEGTATGLLPGRPGAPVAGSELTRAGQILGTPAYVAPELATGGPLTPAVDVFSLGVLAYQLFTGKHPFVEPPLLARLRGREAVRNEPLRSRRDGLPAEAADALDACLALRPEARPSTSDLLDVLKGAKEQLASHVRLAVG